MPDEKANNLAVDSLLGHYRIVRKIGAGGMGEVYLARDEKLDRKVAVKILNEQFSRDAANLRRFVKEAKSASALNHPHILVIYEIGARGETHYIVSEFVEGETLRERLREESLKLPEALEIAVQIAGALAATHAAHIVHRDIKPENIIVRPDGYAKILDFGLAKLVEEKNKSLVDLENETAQQTGTAKGVILGTVNYMSPEQARGERVDERTDIFSFGVLLYEMIAGRTPFAGSTMSDALANLMSVEPQPLARFASDVPDALQRIVAKTLRKNKDERYQTMKGLLADLKELQQDLEFQNKLARQTNPPHQAEAKTQILSAAATDAPHASANETAGKIKKSALVGGLFVLLLASAIGFGLWFFAYRNSTNARQIESIAVMPFTNDSGNSDVEYLSDGMTETLISSLSQLPKLNVKARSSVFRYKGKETSAQTIGKELNVQAILTGRVVERGQDLTLYVELVDAATENVLWKGNYNRPMTNLVSLQNDIARDVADKLKIKLSGADERKLTKNYTENDEAYQLYLKGRFYWLKFPAKEFEKTRDYYQQAIDADPNFALAYAGLSEYYGFGAANGFLPPDDNWSKSEAAARKALAFDDTLPSAHNALAGVKQFNGDRAGAERELRQAIELNPNYAEGRNHYANLLIEVGRTEESLAQLKKVLELEPLSIRFNRISALRFFQARDYDRAIEQYQKTLELDANDAFTRELLGNAYEQKGMQREAVAEWSKALRLTEDDEGAATLESVFAASSFSSAVRALWQHKIERFNEKARRGEYVPAMNYALAYTRLANKEQAFAWLAKAEKERNGLIFEIKLNPIYDSLRDDARFQDLLRRIGLPQ